MMPVKTRCLSVENRRVRPENLRRQTMENPRQGRVRLPSGAIRSGYVDYYAAAATTRAREGKTLVHVFRRPAEVVLLY